MKFSIIFIALMAIVAIAGANNPVPRPSACLKRPLRTNCWEVKNVGYGKGRQCAAGRGDRWWYDRASGKCIWMLYKGCGGNSNRYCTKKACERACCPKRG